MGAQTSNRRLGIAICLVTLFAGTFPALAAAKTLGFFVTRFAPAIYKGENSCPAGLVLTPMQSFLKQIPPSERKRLQRPENSAELERKYKWEFATGRNGEEMCKVPDDRFENEYQHPTQPMPQATISYGMNLDGSDGSGPPPPGIRPHKKFKGPNGETGIDNQLFAAEGCLGWYRGSLTDPAVEAGIITYYDRVLRDGLHPMVIEITVPDDPKADAEVEFGVFSTPDKGYLVGKKIMPDMTYTTTDNPRWRHVVKGRIANGVIKSDVFDLVLNMRWGAGGDHGAHEEFDMRRARFEVTVQPDGSLKGMMGAYEPIDNVYSLFHAVAAGVSVVVGIDCRSEYRALQEMADAYPDPKSGKYTAVSLAYDVEAVPGFLVHPRGTPEYERDHRKTAMTGSKPVAP
jgi:hypothetical protein